MIDEKDFWIKMITGKSIREKDNEEDDVKIRVEHGNEFPYDKPTLKIEEINEMLKASKYLSKDDPAYWDSYRKKCALSNNIVKRRCAVDNWYWYFFKKYKEKFGKEPSLEVLKKQHELDKILHNVAIEFTNELCIIDRTKVTKELIDKIESLRKEIGFLMYKIEMQNNK